MKKTLTSIDVAAVIFELKQQLEGARIQNIYQINGKTLTLKLHQPSQPTLNLLIEAGKRLHLTSYLLKKPQRPPNFCKILRKYLRNGTIADVSQHEFERIVNIKIQTKKEEFKLILELFGNGNLILTEAQETIRQALTFKRMRDRNILRGERFQQPPSSGKNPLHIQLQDLIGIKEFEGLEVVKALTRLLSVGGTYAEEILLRAEIEKNKRCEALDEVDLDRMFKALREILSPIETGELNPCIVIDEKDKWIDVVPVPLRKYETMRCKELTSFNEALDEYYAKTLIEHEVKVATEKVEEEAAKQQRILYEQQKSLEEAKQKAKRSREIGEKIYVHFHELQTLLRMILNEKNAGKTWWDVVSAVEKEKKAGKIPSAYFKSFDARNLVLNVCIDGLSFSLLVRDSVQENAAVYYDRAKKAERKIEGAEEAVKKTLNRLEELKRHRVAAVEKAEKPLQKRRKRAWYEKFRWFQTSEGLLVIGGKDSVTNEILIKRHMESYDLVFHADILGAPFVLLKTESKTPSQPSIEEAAQLAASYSRAWNAKFSAIDVFWVRPEQVSKTPPSGQYLQRGAFMIRGKKNYIRKTPLLLAVGVDFDTKPPAIIGGPENAVKSKTMVLVKIVPGNLQSNRLANKIRQALEGKAPKNLRETISSIPLEEIQAFIPFGRGAMINDYQKRLEAS